MNGPVSGRFRLFVNRTIEFEIGNTPNGGWNQHPSDPGGATQWGISSKYNPEFASKILAKRLTKEEAIGIYYRKYYLRIYGVEKLPASIAFMLFDARVHGSIVSTVADIQRLINFLSTSAVKVDGRYGPETFKAIQKLDKDAVLTLVRMLKISVYQRASKVARATMRTQKRKGIPVYDYTIGFKNRFGKRVDTALSYA